AAVARAGAGAPRGARAGGGGRPGVVRRPVVARRRAARLRPRLRGSVGRRRSGRRAAGAGARGARPRLRRPGGRRAGGTPHRWPLRDPGRPRRLEERPPPGAAPRPSGVPGIAGAAGGEGVATDRITGGLVVPATGFGRARRRPCARTPRPSRPVWAAGT